MGACAGKPPLTDMRQVAADLESDEWLNDGRPPIATFSFDRIMQKYALELRGAGLTHAAVEMLAAALAKDTEAEALYFNGANEIG